MQAETQSSSPVFAPQHIPIETRESFVQHQFLISSLWNGTKDRAAMRVLIAVMNAGDILAVSR